MFLFARLYRKGVYSKSFGATPFREQRNFSISNIFCWTFLSNFFLQIPILSLFFYDKVLNVTALNACILMTNQVFPHFCLLFVRIIWFLTEFRHVLMLSLLAWGIASCRWPGCWAAFLHDLCQIVTCNALSDSKFEIKQKAFISFLFGLKISIYHWFLL